MPPANGRVQSHPVAVESFDDDAKGRGLRVTQDVAAGSELFREQPTAMCLGDQITSSAAAAECHAMVTQIIEASWMEEHAHSVSNLMSCVDARRQQEPGLLEGVAQHATPAVICLMSSERTERRATAVTEDVVVEAYCKHLLNSMTILDGSNLQPVGMGLYAHRGALLNHDSSPNCWTLFERSETEGQPIYNLVVRSLTRIASGDELTIAYTDLAKPAAELRGLLRSRYLFDAPTAASVLPRPGAFEALVKLQALGSPHCDLRELCRSPAWPTTAHLCANSPLLRSLLQGQWVEAGGTEANSEPDAEANGEAAHWIPVVTSLLDQATRDQIWPVALAAGRQLLFLYGLYYPPSYPQLGIRSLQGALTALKLPDMHAAAELAIRGSAILAVSHGSDHELTRSAMETRDLTTAMLARCRMQGAPPVTTTHATPKEDAGGPPAHVRVGSHVRVVGLEAKPEFNGQMGSVVSWDGDKGRAGVKLERGKSLALKPVNLVAA